MIARSWFRILFNRTLAGGGWVRLRRKLHTMTKYNIYLGQNKVTQREAGHLMTNIPHTIVISPSLVYTNIARYNMRCNIWCNMFVTCDAISYPYLRRPDLLRDFFHSFTFQPHLVAKRSDWVFHSHVTVHVFPRAIVCGRVGCLLSWNLFVYGTQSLWQ